MATEEPGITKDQEMRNVGNGLEDNRDRVDETNGVDETNETNDINSANSNNSIIADTNATSLSASASSSKSISSIPSVYEMKRIMRNLSEKLYEEWKKEIAERLRHLEFDGCICREHITVPDEVWRLPNDEVRYALCKLEEDLRSLGYDYEFKFNDVDDVHWVMFYSVSLPEREDDYDKGMLDEEDSSRTISSVDSDLDFAY